MREISNIEIIEKLDEFVPDLIRMRDRIDGILVDIKMFRSTKSVGLDKTRVNVISKVIEDYFDVTMKDLRSKSREGDIRKARQIFCALLKDKTDLSFQRIGDYVSRDHTTVMHSCRVLSDAKETHGTLYDHYTMIDERVCDVLNVV